MQPLKSMYLLEALDPAEKHLVEKRTKLTEAYEVLVREGVFAQDHDRYFEKLGAIDGALEYIRTQISILEAIYGEELP